MNIFALDSCPERSARMLLNKHSVKMPTEQLQLICFCFPEGEAPYKNSRKHAHFNHPAAKFMRESKENFQWGLTHFEVQLDEYKVRYKRDHAAAQHLSWITQNHHTISFPNTGSTPFARCFGPFKEELDKTEPDTVRAYQKFYVLDKIDFAKWPSVEKIAHFWPEKSEKYVDKSFVNGVYSKR
jgi:hypothetical protein